MSTIPRPFGVATLRWDRMSEEQKANVARAMSGQTIPENAMSGQTMTRPAQPVFTHTESTAYTAAYYDEYREATHPKEVPDDPMVLDQKTFRIDQPGDTVTIDPAERSYWIRPGMGQMHAIANERAAYIDAREVDRVAHLAGRMEPDFETYAPTVQDLDALPKYARSRFQCWRGADKDRSREGLLPVYKKLIYDGVLPSKDLRQIEWEQLQAERRIDARLNDTSGWVR